jgi:serine/threonine protein kinase
MSTVYRARDMRFSDIVKFVGIKEMVVQVKDPTIRNNLIRNFREEANILASLRHPFIPRFFDYFSIENRFYIVMEYIVGQDLETILNDTDGLLPVRRALDWGIQLCDVLTYLHTRPLSPVIFRDLKPSNVMVDQHGNIRLIDFNIARVFEMGKKRANIGTQGYSPPEQYHGEVSPQSDIYALGATLHHLLTKKDPRLASPFTFHERKLSKIHPDVSEELETVINKAVAYRPEERYPRVEEMKYALMAVRKSFTSHG